MTTKTPHVHAELIKAWADGAAIQLLGEASGTWYNCIPLWEPRTQYRIKPEHKPDIVRQVGISLDPSYGDVRHDRSKNVRATFDGETLALKSVEMIKEFSS